MTDSPLSFVTGATGFVGAAVARILASKGHNLRLLVRKDRSRMNLSGLSNYEVVEGDLDYPTSYAESLKGCTYVFHVAADYRIWVPDEQAMHRTNVDGTEALMKAAKKADVAKIVYTSSVATLGLPPNGRPGTEDTPVSEFDMIGAYKRSKYYAESRVKNMIEDIGLPAVIVNPSTPIGPRDIRPTPTGRIIVEAASGRMPAYVDTGLNIVHVDDVAMGHWLALERGEIGQRYILGGEDMRFADILAIIAEITGKKAPTIKLPCEPLIPLACVAEFIAQFTKKEPLLTRDGLKMAKKKMFFSSDKATRELGYTARPAYAAIKDAIHWFKENSYI